MIREQRPGSSIWKLWAAKWNERYSVFKGQSAKNMRRRWLDTEREVCSLRQWVNTELYVRERLRYASRTSWPFTISKKTMTVMAMMSLRSENLGPYMISFIIVLIVMNSGIFILQRFDLC